jgi:5-methylcytosine-specific restriction endonuclease McrA
MVKSNDPRLTRKYKSVRLQVLARDEWTCRYCQQDATTVDHVIPIVKGGDPIDMNNMVAACRSCNSSKGSRSEGLFLQRQSTPPVFIDNISPTRSIPADNNPFTARPIGN